MTRRIHLGEGVSYSLFAMCVSFVSISRSFWLRLSCRTEVRELRCSETLFTFAFLVLIFPFINLIDMPFIIFIGFIIWKKNILSYPLSAVRSADELKSRNVKLNSSNALSFPNISPLLIRVFKFLSSDRLGPLVLKTGWESTSADITRESQGDRNRSCDLHPNNKRCLVRTVLFISSS
jgi:hypothetical protein